MALITYADKQAMGTQPSIPDVNKVTDSDMNEIKEAINNSTSYETTEQVIGTWIDGKPIYRKVFTGTLTNDSGNTQSIAHGISNVDKFISHKGFAFTISNQYWTIPLYFSSAQYISLRLSDTYIYFNNTIEFKNKPYTLILEYTKTTD